MKFCFIILSFGKACASWLVSWTKRIVTGKKMKLLFLSLPVLISIEVIRETWLFPPSELIQQERDFIYIYSLYVRYVYLYSQFEIWVSSLLNTSLKLFRIVLLITGIFSLVVQILITSFEFGRDDKNTLSWSPRRKAVPLVVECEGGLPKGWRHLRLSRNKCHRIPVTVAHM